MVIEFDRENRRVTIAGYRIHHFAVGLFLIGFGAVLCAHDWHDRYDAVRFR